MMQEEISEIRYWFEDLTPGRVFDLGSRTVTAGESIRFANEFLDQGQRVLIHCEYGIGRSATLALCLLVHRGQPPLEALALMKKQRPVVSPSPPQFACWSAWLESYRFSQDVEWDVPSFAQFKALAYERGPR